MALSTGISILSLSASVGAGLVFLTAGLTKFRHRMLLEGVVANYRILPQRLVVPAARLLPVAETGVGIALIAGLGRAPALAGIALLLTFAAAMAVNVRRGRRSIDCGCGLSQLRQNIGWPLIVRNLVMAALLAPGLIPSSFLSWPEIAAASFGGVALFLAYLLFNAVDAMLQTSAAAYRRSAS